MGAGLAVTIEVITRSIYRHHALVGLNNKFSLLTLVRIASTQESRCKSLPHASCPTSTSEKGHQDSYQPISLGDTEAGGKIWFIVLNVAH